MVAAASAGMTSVQQAAPLLLFRQLTNGVYVIGTSANGRSNAFTAAWLTQVSFDPLLLSLSINPGNLSYELLDQSGVFAVSILKKDQIGLARHFGCQTGTKTDKLAGQRWGPSSLLGAPVLLDAAGYLECRIVDTVPAGDHVLALGRAVGGEIFDETAEIMTYSDTGNLDGSAELYPPRF